MLNWDMEIAEHSITLIDARVILPLHGVFSEEPDSWKCTLGFDRGMWRETVRPCHRITIVRLTSRPGRVGA